MLLVVNVTLVRPERRNLHT